MKEMNLSVYEIGDMSIQRKDFYVTSKHSVLTIYSYISSMMYPDDKKNYEKYYIQYSYLITAV